MDYHPEKQKGRNKIETEINNLLGFKIIILRLETEIITFENRIIKGKNEEIKKKSGVTK